MGFSFFALGVAIAFLGLGLLSDANMRKHANERRHPRIPR
jgi:hypothetical protein